MSWRDTLAETDWLRVHESDAPTHLRALAESDDAARDAAMAYLWGTILHQGTAYEATAPAARVVAEILRDAQLNVRTPTRAALVGFLGGVGAACVKAGLSREELARRAADPLPDDPEEDEAFSEDEAAADALYARAILACIAIRPELCWRSPDSA
jgi:hypothetical protein